MISFHIHLSICKFLTRQKRQIQRKCLSIIFHTCVNLSIEVSRLLLLGLGMLAEIDVKFPD